jgi:group I intron endonuclease
MAHIYRILNVVTDQFYIGSAVKFKRRRWEHWDALKKNAHHCVKLQEAWNEYGADAFEFEVLEEVSDADALRIEDTYLAQHAGTAACYNTATTTMQPPSVSNDTREKIRAAMLRLYADPANHPRAGKTHSEETKAKISASKRANPATPWQGKHRSEETKAKISAAQKGVPKAPRTFTPDGLARAQENMKRNAREQAPADFATVKAKFPEAVLARYNFGAAVYTGALSRITGCVCPDHGEFSQYAAQFRKGRGCPACGAEQRAQSKKQQMLNDWDTEKGRERYMRNRSQKAQEKVGSSDMP